MNHPFRGTLGIGSSIEEGGEREGVVCLRRGSPSVFSLGWDTGFGCATVLGSASPPHR